MEKRAVVEPGRTPQEERPGEKKAAAETQREQTQALDDDFTKRAADRSAAVLKQTPGS